MTQLPIDEHDAALPSNLPRVISTGCCQPPSSSQTAYSRGQLAVPMAKHPLESGQLTPNRKSAGGLCPGASRLAASFVTLQTPPLSVSTSGPS